LKSHCDGHVNHQKNDHAAPAILLRQWKKVGILGRAILSLLQYHAHPVSGLEAYAMPAYYSILTC
jgi:hypothetical protein